MATRKRGIEDLPSERVVRLERHGDEIMLSVLKPQRLTTHGFGTYFEDVKDGEISVTQEALDAFLKCRYRSGVQGMEVFGNRILAWGDPFGSTVITVPIDAISLHQGASKWLQQCSVVE